MKLIILLGLSVQLLLSSNVVADDYSALYKKLNPSVVTIQTVEVVRGPRGLEQKRAIGSGVLIDAKGLVMTASHVVHTADKIGVRLSKGKTVQAEVVSSVPSTDLALIKLRSPIDDDVPAATLGDSDKVQIGQTALVIGAPFGLQHTLSVGHISGKQRRNIVAGGQPLQLIQTDAAINHGNSGGPIFDEQGEVIGIVSHIVSQGNGSDGVGFAVSINNAKKVLLESPSFWTGFEGVELPPEVAQMLNIPQKSAVLVQRVTQGSIADKAGLKGGIYKANLLGQDVWLGGDAILEIQGLTCDSPHNFEQIRNQIHELQPGESLSMIVLRKGKKTKLQFAMQ